MINILLMLGCFCLFIGIGMLYYKFTQLTSVESLGISVVSIIFVQFISGILGNVAIGVYILYSAGLAGIAVFFLPFYKKKKKSGFFSLGLLIITAGFVYALIAFQNTIIHNVDEFNQWAKAALYVNQTGLLPVSGMFSGIHPAGTTLFHSFFVYLPGYVESNLYCSGFLLTWTGLMLPFSVLGWKDWKQASLYTLLVFLALYVLYPYPYMSLYVDMPVAVWSGGMAALWYMRENKKQVVPLLIGILFIVSLFKYLAGPLFAAALIFFVIVIQVYSSDLSLKARIQVLRNKFGNKIKWLYLALPIVIMLLILAVIKLIPIITAIGDLFSKSSGHGILAIKACIKAALNRNIGVSSLNITYFSCIIAYFVIAAVLYFFIKNQKKNYKWLLLFYLLGAGVYFVVLVFNNLFTFSYNESIRAASINRYFSIYVVFGLPLLLSPLLLYHPGKKARIAKMLISLALIGALCFGINESFFTTYIAAPDPAHIKYYQDITKIRNSSEDINKIVPENSKILFVAQKTKGVQISIASYTTYGRAPIGVYDFLDGKRTNISQNIIPPPIDQIGKFIIENGYEYLWIYKTDTYFTMNTGELLNTKIVEGGLYKIIQKKNNRIEAQFIGIF